MLLIQMYAHNLRFIETTNKNIKTTNIEIIIQRIQKYKYKKYRNAANPGAKCMHSICALQLFRPTATTSGTLPKQLTKCKTLSHNVQCAWPLAKH